VLADVTLAELIRHEVLLWATSPLEMAAADDHIDT
jgi:hypothetical protein